MQTESLLRALLPLTLILAACGGEPSGPAGKDAVDADQDGYSFAGGDCDDNDATVNPAATETPDDGVDQDCNPGNDLRGLVDEDADGSTADLDCNDADASIFPGAPELCNGADEDCDGVVDNDAPADNTWYEDGDGDGYGAESRTTQSCLQPEGYAPLFGDCDDFEYNSNPGATEHCDGADNDCDGDQDEEAVDALPAYVDHDGDGFGEEEAELLCDLPSGYADRSGDCDDRDAQVSPDATEACNGLDDNCDGSTDGSDAIDALKWYADTDGDSLGDAANTRMACSQPSGYVTNTNDCDDGTVSIGAPILWYLDTDMDGYGSIASIQSSCTQPAGYSSTALDCDDENPEVSPLGTESCNGLDDNCDGSTDGTDAVDVQTFYMDHDSDGYGDAAYSRIACYSPGSGYTTTVGDCDDTNSAAYPGANELCNSIDDDCDGTTDESTATNATTWYRDSDSDGYGVISNYQRACTQPVGYVSSNTDCSDVDATIHPGGTETCNGRDDDCDSSTDESGSTGETTWYADGDRDGYGSSTYSLAACNQPAGYVSAGTDCDDGNSNAYPGGVETQDGADQDCDGYIDDGYVVAGDVVITEMARQPVFGGLVTDLDGQWFELYNTSNQTLYLDNWLISNGSASFQIDPAEGIQMASGEHLVFCAASTWTSTTIGSYLVCDYIWDDGGTATAYRNSSFTLGSRSGSLSVYMNGTASSANLVDTVAYTMSWASAPGFSLQLDVYSYDATDNNSSAQWCKSPNTSMWYAFVNGREYGTPGVSNSSCN